MPPTRLRSLGLAAAAVLTSACSSPTEIKQIEPTALGLYVGDVKLNRFSAVGILPGSNLTFSVRLTDAGGRIVSGLRPTLVSRNQQSLTLDARGVLTVVGRGASWIVGSVVTPAQALLADSTLVNVVCTVALQPAITLTVVDSSSGTSAGLTSIYITIQSGLARDTVFVSSVPTGAPPFSVGLAFERVGTYDLTATAAGYRVWTQTGVVVDRDLCHVITVPIAARLQRL